MPLRTLLHVILAYCLCLCPILVKAQEGSCGVGVTWALVDSVLTIQGEGEMYDHYYPSESSYYIYKDQIKQVIVNEGVVSIGQNAFNGFTVLEYVQFSEGLAIIKASAFQNCSGVKEIILPKSLITIERLAFMACGMKTLTVSEGLNNLGYDAFSDCTNLTTVYWNADMPVENCEKTNNISNDFLTSASSYFTNCNIKDVFIGENVKFIPNGLFLNGMLSVLSEIHTTGNLEYIGYKAFDDATVPSAINQDGIIYIDKCLYGCEAYENIPSKVEVKEGTVGITRAAFLQDVFLTEITLPSTLKYIGSGVFAKCTSLGKLIYNAIDCNLLSIDWQISTLESGGYTFNSALSSIVFGDKVISIPDYIFHKCIGLRNIGFSPSIVSIGKDAFSDCSGLISVSLGNVQEIGPHAFSQCPIENLVLPETIESLGTYCFSGVKDLSKLTLGSNLKYWSTPFNAIKITIDTLVYKPVTKPTDFSTVAKKTNHVIFDNQVEEIGTQFNFIESGNNPLTVTFGESAKFFSRWYADTIFWCAVHAESVDQLVVNNIVFGDKVETIPRNSITDANITQIVFPESLKKIENVAFNTCRNLTKVVCPWHDPREVETSTNAFASSVLSQASLYVPKGSKERYQAMEPWNKFSYIIEDSTTWEKPQCEMPTISYSDGKLIIVSETTNSTCFYTITDEDIVDNVNANNQPIALSACYHITAIATAPNYVDSYVSESCLYFLDASDDSEALESPLMRGIVVTQTDDQIIISGLNPTEEVSLYSVDGKFLDSTKAVDGTAVIFDASKGIRILSIANHSIKLIR